MNRIARFHAVQIRLHVGAVKTFVVDAERWRGMRNLQAGVRVRGDAVFLPAQHLEAEAVEDEDLPDVPDHPLVEDGREEAAPGLRVHRAVGHPVGPLALLKGGHREGELVTDTLITRFGREDFTGARIAATKRGTGCRLASFLAGRLAQGAELRSAVLDARSFVRTYLSAP